MKTDHAIIDIVVDGLIKTIHRNTPTNDLDNIELPECKEAMKKYLLEVIANCVVTLGNRGT